MSYSYYTHLIAQYKTDCMFLVWLTCICDMHFGNTILKNLSGIRLPMPAVSILYVIDCPCWLVLDTSFVNKWFTLSNSRYLIFTKQKLLSLCSHPSGQWSSPCWFQAWTCQSLVTSGFVAVSAPTCTLPWKWLTLLQLPHKCALCWALCLG